MNKTKKPRIRFKGFTDDWEQRKVGEFLTVSKIPGHTGIDAKKLTVKLWGKGIIGKNDVFTGSENTKYYIRRAGQFMYGKLDFLHAAFGIVPEHLDTYESTLDSPAFDMHDIDSHFLLERVMQKNFYLHNGIIANGSRKAKRIHENIFLDMDLVVPSYIEQEKIGSIFRSLDDLITLHQRKCEKLKIIKKSMIENCFPKNGQKVPKIRFSGFTGDWEQRKLGDIATFINGRAYSQTELLDEGKYRVLRVGNFYTNDSWYYSNIELPERYYANDGDLLYTWSATFGPHIWHGEKVIYHYHIWKIELANTGKKHFMVQLLDRDKEALLAGHNGSTMIHITKSGMEQKHVMIPVDATEQDKIGVFFTYLDKTITLHQRKLEKLKKIKKSMLERMFV